MKKTINLNETIKEIKELDWDGIYLKSINEPDIKDLKKLLMKFLITESIEYTSSDPIGYEYIVKPEMNRLEGRYVFEYKRFIYIIHFLTGNDVDIITDIFVSPLDYNEGDQKSYEIRNCYIPI